MRETPRTKEDGGPNKNEKSAGSVSFLSLVCPPVKCRPNVMKTISSFVFPTHSISSACLSVALLVIFHSTFVLIDSKCLLFVALAHGATFPLSKLSD